MRKTKAAALITTLFIMALCAIVSTAIMVNQRLLIHQTELLFGYDQLAGDLNGVIYWAESEIKSSLNQQGLSIGLLQHSKFPSTTLNGITLQGHVVDAQAYYNINALAQTIYEPSFDRLLAALNIQNQPTLAQNISNWITGAANVDDYYMKQTPPYRAGHTQMADKTELRAVEGVTQTIYTQLAPWVVALPNNQLQINANTTSPLIIRTLANKMSISKAQQFLSCGRDDGGFQSQAQVDNCANQLGVNTNDLEKALTYNTSFFLLFATATNGEQTLHLRALLQLYKNHYGKPAVNVVYQSIE